MKFLSILMFEISNSRRINSISHLIRMFVSVGGGEESTRKSVAIREKHKRSENEFEQNDFPQVSSGENWTGLAFQLRENLICEMKSAIRGKQRSTPARATTPICSWSVPIIPSSAVKWLEPLSIQDKRSSRFEP